MKVRLDQLMVEQGLAESQERAQRLIRAGLVVAGDHMVDKPGHKLNPLTAVRLKSETCAYVSRGGIKLATALNQFALSNLNGKQTLDIGASTGGFTDCLLQHGAAHVWALDTGAGQLHSTLCRNPRVSFRPHSNARHLKPEWIDRVAVDLVTVDVSFISLRLILPPLANVLAPGGSVVTLIKPQFEASPENVARGGVVRERAVHRHVIVGLIQFAQNNGWHCMALCASPLLGPAGNREFFAHLSYGIIPIPKPIDQLAIERAIEQVYNDSPGI